MKIPVDKHHWINCRKFDERGSAYVIERNSKGREARYQYNGVGCYQGRVEGFLSHHFHSDLKWFSSSHWYQTTRWGSDYPKALVVSTPETKAIMDKFNWDIDDESEFDKMYDEIHNELSKYGIPTKDILQEILQETIEKTGIQFELDCDIDSYDKEWWEAHVPLKFNGKKFLLTWENCD